MPFYPLPLSRITTVFSVFTLSSPLGASISQANWSIRGGVCVFVCVYMYVCRLRERERERESQISDGLAWHSIH